jgi:hypothetical protein
MVKVIKILCNHAIENPHRRPDFARGGGARNVLDFRSRRPLALKLDTAFFGNRGLFDRDHLAFHLSKLGRRLLIALQRTPLAKTQQ